MNNTLSKYGLKEWLRLIRAMLQPYATMHYHIGGSKVSAKRLYDSFI
jgi:hypothetical protein